MNTLAVGIVEDEMIIAEDMRDMLEAMGYQVSFIAASAGEAKRALEKKNTDIVLLDIRISGDESGIELAKAVQRDYDIPFIYVTSNADKSTVAEAKQTYPYGYILKPFDDKDLYTAIEIAITNFNQRKGGQTATSPPEDFVINDSIFIRDKKFLVKLKFTDILYLQSDGNYTYIYTSKQKYTLRTTLKELESKLPDHLFVRIHKSYIILLQALSAINAESVLIGDRELPLGRNYQEWIMARINKL